MPEAFTGIYDIKMTPDGDLSIKGNDLELVNGHDWFIQEVMKILKTNNPDWELHPNAGASLEDFVGQPNTRDVGRAMETRIYEKISEEGLNFPGKLTVRAVPLSTHEVYVYILLEVEDIRISVSKKVFDLVNGLQRNISEDELDMIAQKTSSRATPARNPYLTRIK